MTREVVVIWRGLGLGVRLTCQGWRPWVLVAGLALLWLFCRFTNPWDLLLYSTAGNVVAIVVVPMYLLLAHRDLRHAWEALSGVRLGNARTWWAVQIGVSGFTALGVVAGLVVLVVFVPLVTGDWTWHWGTFAQGFLGTAIRDTAWRVAWLWGVEALGLLFVGLWSMGVLSHVLGLWWHAPWAALGAVMLLSFGSLSMEGIGPGGLTWWLPGPQFALADHWATTGYVPALWSVGYAVILLCMAAAAGVVIADAPPWDVVHGGTP